MVRSVARALGVALIAAGCGSRTDVAGIDVVGPPCEKNSDCVVVPRSCCGSCGAATRQDFRLLNRTKALAEPDPCVSAVCSTTCFAAPDPTLLATCSGGLCRLLDLQKDDATSCATDSDCVVRSSACLGCGDGNTLVAVRDSESLDRRVCDDYRSGSAPCSAPAPASATCTAGRCALGGVTF